MDPRRRSAGLGGLRLAIGTRARAVEKASRGEPEVWSVRRGISFTLSLSPVIRSTPRSIRAAAQSHATCHDLAVDTQGAFARAPVARHLHGREFFLARA